MFTETCSSPQCLASHSPERSGTDVNITEINSSQKQVTVLKLPLPPYKDDWLLQSSITLLVQ